MNKRHILAVSISVLATVAHGRTLFNITFDDPPHAGGIVGDNSITPPAVQPWYFSGNSSITNYTGMDGPAAFVESGASLGMFFGSPNPPYSPVSTSGLNIISWKVAITDWVATSDNPSSGLTYQWHLGMESLVSGDPFITLRFEYFGGTSGVVRLSHDGYINTYRQIATFTTGVTYSVSVAIDLDEDSYSVWFDGTQVVTNMATGPWFEIMHVDMGNTVASSFIIDDVSWTVIDRPTLMLLPQTNISWQTDTELTYQLEATTNIVDGSWNVIVSNIVSPYAVISMPEPLRDQPLRIYRLRTGK